MGKVGIITYHFVSNYGAAMQSYALQEVLRRLGHDAYLIDYRPSHLTSGGKFFFPRNKRELKMNIIKLLLKLRFSLFSSSLINQTKENKFKQFREEYFSLTEKTYYHKSDLFDEFNDFDFLVCGSDQIWNSSPQKGIDEAYFLDFVPDSNKKVSYAASFGRPFVTEHFKHEVGALIKSFNYISVREDSGVTIVKDLTGLSAKQVLDPTLLLGGQYPQAITSKEKSKYIFSYTLRSKKLSSKVNDFVSKSTGLRIITVESLKGKGVALSPLEWVGYFKGAEKVITNSYHGTVFSIIFRKPFVFVALCGSKSDFNERSRSLLDTLGLSDLILSRYDEESVGRLLKKKYDWDAVHSKINLMREDSEDFLNEALSVCHK